MTGPWAGREIAFCCDGWNNGFTNPGLDILDVTNKQQIQLQAENTALASQLSSASSSLRIEQAARRLGLVPAPASDTSYLELGH